MSGEENVHQQMNKSASVQSVDSTLSFQSDDLTEDKIYEVAPWDIFGDAAGVGRVKVAKVGDNLPLTTGYKVKKDGSAQVGVKFRISEYLGVEVVKVKHLSAAEREKINGSIPCSSSEGKKATAVDDEPKNNHVEVNTSKESVEKTAATKEPPVEAAIVPDGPRTKSKQEWLHDFGSNFIDIVVGGMEASIRKLVASSIHEKKALKGKSNQAVINSVNHAIFEFIGNQRPTKEFCRDVAEIIKKHIPDTYAVVETMESAEFGSLPVKKAKGEGGQSDLATRIGNNYYNDYLRGHCAAKSVTGAAKPVTGVSKSVACAAAKSSTSAAVKSVLSAATEAVISAAAKSVTSAAAKSVTEVAAASGHVKKVKRKVKVVKQPAVKLEMCEYEKIRMDSINEQRELLLKLGLLKPKEKKVKQKRKLKLNCDQAAPARRSARLCDKN